MARLTFEPLIPASLWLLLAVAAAAAVLLYAWSRPGRMRPAAWSVILVLMTAGIALVMLVLLNPTWIDPVEPPGGKPLVTVLVDASASMAVRDAEDGLRSETARRIAESLQEDLRHRFDVRVRTFSGGVAPVESSRRWPPPVGTITDVAGAVADSVEADRRGGQSIVLLSDGIHNAGAVHRELREAMRSARAAGAPVYTYIVGRADTPELRDREARVRSPQTIAYVGQRVPITVRVRERAGPGGAMQVSLFERGERIGSREITAATGAWTETTFEVTQDAPGIYRYEARVDASPGELVGANNTAVLFLRVLDEPIRVLLLEGKPYWDTKFLVRTLAGDPVVALDSVVRMAEGRFVRRSLTPMPASDSADAAARAERWTVLPDGGDLLGDAKALEDYQIVVLGRDTDVFLSDAALERLRHWIARQGGALVCSRGAPASRLSEKLAQILPVQWTQGTESRFRMVLTERGQDVRWIGDVEASEQQGVFARMPSLATDARAEPPRPTATVLATAMSAETGREQPVISCLYYGTGRVVVVEGSGMWRWAFLPPEQQALQGVYGSVWQSLVRWIVGGTGLRPGQDLALRSERVLFESNETASVGLLVNATVTDVPQVELFVAGEPNAIGSFAPSPAGSEPGAFTVMFGRLPPGQYEARAAGRDELVCFDVRAPVREQLELAARPDLMAAIAADSGGAVLEQASARDVTRLYDAYVQRNQPPRERRVSAWDRWYVLLGVLGIWATCWGVRRANGLI